MLFYFMHHYSGFDVALVPGFAVFGCCSLNAVRTVPYFVGFEDKSDMTDHVFDLFARIIKTCTCILFTSMYVAVL